MVHVKSEGHNLNSFSRYRLNKLVPLCFSPLLALVLSVAFTQDDPIAKLSTKFPVAQRMTAEQKLLDMGPEAIVLLRKGLGHSDESIRIGSIRLLGELKTKDAVPDLIRYLRSAKDTRTLLVTSYALGQIQDKRASSDLISAASSAENDIIRRRGAIIALGLLGDISSIPALEKILADDEELLRVFAAGSLGLLGSEKGLYVAIHATESTDSSIRRHAIQVLGLIGSSRGLDVLYNLLRQKPSMVERQTIELAIFQINLQGLSTENKVSRIKTKVLSTPKSTSLTMWGIDELYRIGGPSAEAALDELSRSHSSENIRMQATRKHRILNFLERMDRGEGK